MEIKKADKVNLDKKKGLFFEIGLFFAILFALVAFEWKTYEKKESGLLNVQFVLPPEEEIEQTKQDEPQMQQPPQVFEIKVVEDDVEVDDDIDFVDLEDKVEIEETYIEKAVQEEDEVVEQEIFTIVEEQPSFPGGEAALFEYLKKNIVYPTIAKESGIQGTVFVQFVVEPDGSVSNVKVLRGIGGGCDEEAVRVVKSMPRWNPGKQRGKPVRVYFNLPIRFVLQ